MEQAVELGLFLKKILRLCSNNRMEMDANLFKTIENENFGKFYTKLRLV
jgi:hypothetical protein